MPFYSNGFGDLLEKNEDLWMKVISSIYWSTLPPKGKAMGRLLSDTAKNSGFFLDSWSLNFRMGGWLNF